MNKKATKPKEQVGCGVVQVNHYLDPVEYDCSYNTTIDCGDCKYGKHGGRKDPLAKVNQPKAS